MPPKCKFTKEEIIKAALSIARQHGIESVTARAVGAELNSSSKVIFSTFNSMDELQKEVLNSAKCIYNNYLNNEMKSGKYPAYKASGMAYIRFAQEEKELFKLLFMRDRTDENVNNDYEEVKPIVNIIMKNTGLCEKVAYMIHLEMWIYVHGIATMVATSYLDWKWEDISQMLTNCYEGTRKRYMEGK